MKKDLVLHIEVDSYGFYKVVSEGNGIPALVIAGNVNRQNAEFDQRIGAEVYNCVKRLADKAIQEDNDRWASIIEDMRNF